MTLFLSYLRRHFSYLLLLAAFAGIFAVMLFLYRIPLEGALYGTLLCVFAGGIFLAIGFLRYRSRHLLLQQLEREASLPLHQLPDPRDMVEEDYQELLETVLLRDRTAMERQRTELREAEDYYTLWVHQVKTPLAAMNLLLQQEEDDRSRELRSQLFKTEQYVEMVLAYLRMGSESSDLVIKPQKIEALVRQSVRKYATLFIGKDLHLELGPLSGETVSDEKWLCFAIEQILSNAIKYTPSSGIIRIWSQDGILTIQDTGAGIAPEDLPRIFEKGYTGCNGRLDNRSSGIGLYLTRKILRRLGHSISVSSRLGAGTTVTIDLNTAPLQPI